MNAILVNSFNFQKLKKIDVRRGSLPIKRFLLKIKRSPLKF